MKLPSFITDLLAYCKIDTNEGLDHETIEICSRRISQDLSKLEHQEIAGKSIIWNISRNCTDVDSYLKLCSHRLTTDVKQFIINNEDTIDEFSREYDHLNYYNRDYFSASTIINNYLLRSSVNEPALESPVFMYLRIGIQLYSPDIDRVLMFAKDMGYQHYIPSSPTFFNSGLEKHQLASCFLLPIEDKLEDILKTGVWYAGMISSLSGGLGIGLSNIRHSQIGDFGMSDGIIPACKVFDKLVLYANQSGRRKGSATGFLRSHHIDLMDFIQSTDNFNISHENRLTAMNTCIWMSKLFFKRVRDDKMWTLFCPAKSKALNGVYGVDFEIQYAILEEKAAESLKSLNDVKVKLEESRNAHHDNPDDISLRDQYLDVMNKHTVIARDHIVHKTVRARDVLDKIIELQQRCGMPYICHGDAINMKSNHKNMGSINNSNLCLEIMEYAGEGEIASCNLGSLNLASFVNEEGFDFDLLALQTKRAVESLDKVIDRNYYPLGDDGPIAPLNKRVRPIGLGVSGLADAFAMLDMKYESDDASLLNKKIFACMYFNSLIKSVELAIENGEYETFRTGSYECYYNTIESGMEFHVLDGSPLYNGMFQFDLWKEDYRIEKDLGYHEGLDEELMNVKEIEPTEWGHVEVEIAGTNEVVKTWEDLRRVVMKYGVRNSLLMALMPTASSAQSVRNAESTEAHQTNIYSRNVQSGHFTVMNRWMVGDLEDVKLWDKNTASFIMLCNGSLKWIDNYFDDHSDKYPSWNDVGVRNRIKFLKDKYKTQFEISQKYCMTMARDRGIYIDQSQSLNIYFEHPTFDKLRACHLYGNRLGLKTGQYYLRAGSVTNPGSFAMAESSRIYYNELLKKKGIDTSVSGYKDETVSSSISNDNNSSNDSGDYCMMCQ